MLRVRLVDYLSHSLLARSISPAHEQLSRQSFCPVAPLRVCRIWGVAERDRKEIAFLRDVFRQVDKLARYVASNANHVTGDAPWFSPHHPSHC